MSGGSMRRAVVLVGLLATFLFVVGGVWWVMSLVWAFSFVQTLEVAVASPFLAGWVLAPLMWAARKPKGADDDAGPVGLVAAITMVGVGAVSYGYEFALLPLAFGVEPGLSSILVVLVTPALQWLVVIGAGAIETLRSRSA